MREDDEGEGDCSQLLSVFCQLVFLFHSLQFCRPSISISVPSS
jgi:hypothetical protein